MMDCATNSAVRSSKVIPGDQNVESLFPVKVDVPESLLSIAHDNDQPQEQEFTFTYYYSPAACGPTLIFSV